MNISPTPNNATVMDLRSRSLRSLMYGDVFSVSLDPFIVRLPPGLELPPPDDPECEPVIVVIEVLLPD